MQLDAATLATTPGGSTTTPLSAQTRTVTLFDGTIQLDEKTIAGGWLGEGCVDATVVNRAGYARGTTAQADPTLSLYDTNDPALCPGDLERFVRSLPP